MKTIIAATIIALTAIGGDARAETHGFVEVHGNPLGDHPELTLAGYLRHKHNDRFGFTLFTLMENNWAQALVGLVVTANEHLEFGISMGAEQDHGHFKMRYALYLWTGNEGLSASLIVEANNQTFHYWKDGLYYDLTLLMKFHEWLSVGLRDRRPSGIGLVMCAETSHLLEACISWLPIESETAALQPKSLLLGLKYQF